MKALRWIGILLLLLCVMLMVPSSIVVGRAEIIEIPMDTVQAPEPQEDGYVSDWEYHDPSISVVIERGVYLRTPYFAAHIKIANASQIRTVMAGDYLNDDRRVAPVIAKRARSVLAVNGDFFVDNRGKGLAIRQGKTYRELKDNEEENSHRNYDLLLIDDKGDFHILKQATVEDVKAFQGTIVNSFTFGPGLIIDGEPQHDFVNMMHGEFKAAQRAVVAQVGELEYLVLCSEGPDDPPARAGLTMDQLTDLLYSFGNVQNAYNLDGGTSSAMVFRQGKNKYAKINAQENPNSRPIFDLICFCSAYVPD